MLRSGDSSRHGFALFVTNTLFISAGLLAALWLGVAGAGATGLPGAAVRPPGQTPDIVYPVGMTPEGAIAAALAAAKSPYTYIGPCDEAIEPRDTGKFCSELALTRPTDSLRAYRVDFVENRIAVGSWFFVRSVGGVWQVVYRHDCTVEDDPTAVPWP